MRDVRYICGSSPHLPTICDYCLHVSSVTQNLVEMCDYACVVELEYTFGLSPNAFMDWGFDSLRKYHMTSQGNSIVEIKAHNLEVGGA